MFSAKLTFCFSQILSAQGSIALEEALSVRDTDGNSFASMLRGEKIMELYYTAIQSANDDSILYTHDGCILFATDGFKVTLNHRPADAENIDDRGCYFQFEGNEALEALPVVNESEIAALAIGVEIRELAHIAESVLITTVAKCDHREEKTGKKRRSHYTHRLERRRHCRHRRSL